MRETRATSSKSWAPESAIGPFFSRIRSTGLGTLGMVREVAQGATTSGPFAATERQHKREKTGVG